VPQPIDVPPRAERPPPLRCALHCYSELVSADMHGNLWTSRNSIGRAAEEPKGNAHASPDPP
jgi:hypothetical protein